MTTTRRVAWQMLAWISFALGVIGAFVPLMPSTCFLLVAVWAASKGSPRFARWIREHPRFGPAVVAWEESGAIPRHAKWMALVMLSLSVIVLLFTVSLWWLKLGLVTMLAGIAIWIFTRPEPASSS
ncbi:YbaN family protein [Halomonas sp. DP4Y7-1]|nr:YbaN family protein [Halomonas litopenaei]MBY5927441.1 YbaN family protein [Halomonas sp. DP4Y7-2]MBY5931357.1 YbaN family protein [Halomonas sp. DP8Y7-3]MBY5970652.1 YbaN family protein [Halomonas denitrificans]MBY5986247.1 YbaN family protein [Halomonas sp. DP5Y7-2]MBY6030054.1 YbaN family protein [Halomonas sp. DP8Y7-1]MBY6209478.1 YbaN family protein [Halomonas sp. DP3Y7-2]MBY6230570.1 YbaN family protein [Halomonas sp. DP3Y7-1]MBY6234482.1 YbaN family protein [Halomonas sp. DP4Y7-1]